MCPPVLAIVGSLIFTPVVAGVVGTALTSIGITSALAATVVSGALVGGMTSVISGGKFGQGALFGAITAGVASSASKLYSGATPVANATKVGGAPPGAPFDPLAGAPGYTAPAPAPFDPLAGAPGYASTPAPAAQLPAAPVAAGQLPAAGAPPQSMWDKAKASFTDNIGEIAGRGLAGGMEGIAKAKATDRETAARLDERRMMIDAGTATDKAKYAGLDTPSTVGYLDTGTAVGSGGADVPNWRQYYADMLRRNGQTGVPAPAPVGLLDGAQPMSRAAPIV